MGKCGVKDGKNVPIRRSITESERGKWEETRLERWAGDRAGKTIY